MFQSPEIENASKVRNVKKCLPQKSISEFCKKRPSLEEKIARLVAEDGLNFKQIAESKGIREAFKTQGYDIPKHHTTVRELFMKEYANVKNKKIEELKSRVESGERFSLAVDEASGVRNRRYEYFIS